MVNMSSVRARNFIVSAEDLEKSVQITLNTPSSSYTIHLPTAPPQPKSTLFFDGSQYIWQEVVQSIPASSIPQGYETYQVFNTNLLLQSPDVEFTGGDVNVRMRVGDGGVVFFQKYDDSLGEWVGATISLDGS